MLKSPPVTVASLGRRFRLVCPYLPGSKAQTPARAAAAADTRTLRSTPSRQWTDFGCAFSNFCAIPKAWQSRVSQLPPSSSGDRTGLAVLTACVCSFAVLWRLLGHFLFKIRDFATRPASSATWARSAIASVFQALCPETAWHSRCLARSGARLETACGRAPCVPFSGRTRPARAFAVDTRRPAPRQAQNTRLQHRFAGRTRSRRLS